MMQKMEMSVKRSVVVQVHSSVKICNNDGMEIPEEDINDYRGKDRVIGDDLTRLFKWNNTEDVEHRPRNREVIVNRGTGRGGRRKGDESQFCRIWGYPRR